MTKTPKNPHGIFCLETIWFNEQRNPSTSSLLELLERLHGIPFAYRDISTWEELDFCLGRWVCRDMYKKDYQLDNLGILYLGFHGGPAQILLRGDSPQRSKEKNVILDEIAESLTNEKSRYDASYGAIHFAFCSVLRAPARAKKFKEKVGASCVSGYSKVVDSNRQVDAADPGVGGQGSRTRRQRAVSRNACPCRAQQSTARSAARLPAYWKTARTSCAVNPPAQERAATPRRCRWNAKATRRPSRSSANPPCRPPEAQAHLAAASEKPRANRPGCALAERCVPSTSAPLDPRSSKATGGMAGPSPSPSARRNSERGADAAMRECRSPTPAPAAGPHCAIRSAQARTRASSNRPSWYFPRRTRLQVACHGISPSAAPDGIHDAPSPGSPPIHSGRMAGAVQLFGGCSMRRRRVSSSCWKRSRFVWR